MKDLFVDTNANYVKLKTALVEIKRADLALLLLNVLTDFLMYLRDVQKAPEVNKEGK